MTEDWTSWLTEKERWDVGAIRQGMSHPAFVQVVTSDFIQTIAALRALVEEKDKALHAICDKAVLTGRYGGEGIWWEIEKNGSDDLVNAAVALGLSEEDMLKEGK